MSYFDEKYQNTPQEEETGFFGRLKRGLSKTRKSISYSLDTVFGAYDAVGEDFYEEIEEILVMADVGVKTTSKIIEDLKEAAAGKKISDPSDVRSLLIEVMKNHMRVNEAEYRFEKEKSVILVIGVNGTGKTTSAGKLAAKLKNEGKRVLLCAADTFRAAADEQLRTWASRAGCEIISGNEGADPASVVFDSVSASKARNVDVMICDTAGRLHNKKNLMNELHKIYTILEREYPEAYLETLVVVDGTTGQNALSQAKEFSEVARVSGVILTKLDGTAKGGIAVAIQDELGIPVKYIGVGETLEDMQKFDPDAFIDALFDSASAQ
ncbi:MAG: signal recognition particle-docking protein FtsY [Lachnospiraceae bacterium]|jgi:fused signal recognition particle receptor